MSEGGAEFWSALSATAAAVAALVSAYQAWKFRDQVDHDRKAAKVAAAIAQSPYLSDEFNRSFKVLERKFGFVDPKKPPSAEAVNAAVYEDAEVRNSLLFVLNFWGRFATAYEENVVDREVAERTLRRGFVRFFRFFELYFDVHMVKSQYVDTLKLYEEWKAKE